MFKTLLFFVTFLYSFDFSIINQSYLQYPNSHHKKINFNTPYFYIQNNNLIFYMCNKHNRSELRLKQLFKASTFKPQILKASIKPLSFNAKEFTFLQIHTFKSINKPLLRIVYKNKKIMAIIKLKKGYKKIKFYNYKPQFYNITLTVKNSILTIKINNKIYTQNIKYWDKYQNYFKAGVYLQTNGCAKAIFKKLSKK